MKNKKIMLVSVLFIFVFGSACFAIDMFSGIVEKQKYPGTDYSDNSVSEDTLLTMESVLETPLAESLETQAAFGDLSVEQVQATVNAASGMDLEEIREKFFVPESAIYITSIGEMVNYQIMQPLVDVLDYFQIQFARQGLHYEEAVSEITEITATLVYSGHENGKTMVVQLVALNSVQTNVTIQFEE